MVKMLHSQIFPAFASRQILVRSAKLKNVYKRAQSSRSALVWKPEYRIISGGISAFAL
jgi:hypothetical protein